MNDCTTIDHLWEQAEQRFRDRTKKELRTVDQKSLEDVVMELRSKFQNQDTDVSQRRAQPLLVNTLKCINFIGRIAAEGASTVG